MGERSKINSNWKTKLHHEMIEYGINVIYLTLVFAAFTQYRRWLLAAHDITYTNYWFALMEALVLGKVIMLGSLIKLGRGLESKPLIYPTLYKTVMFTIFVALFTLLEHMLKGVWNGVGAMQGMQVLLAKGHHELLAGSLTVFVSLFPFFGVKELGRVLGKEKIVALFFRRRDDA